jgi:hypothetical protein
MSKIRAKEKRKLWPQKRLSSGHRRTVFGTLKDSTKSCWQLARELLPNSMEVSNCREKLERREGIKFGREQFF